ncbi:MAG: hypothetical protein WC919_02660 [Candidatus Paceibacterota bacterium]|jgi:DNA-directed RNA polymerase subunit M/transcription elongation factor TFIIS
MTETGGKSRDEHTRDLFENIIKSSYGDQKTKMPISEHNMGVIIRGLESGCRKVARTKCEEQLIDPSIVACDYFTHMYSSCVYKICELLRDPKHELLSAILGRRIASRDVASMDMIALADYCPSILREERQEFAARLAQKTEVATTALYECAKCHMRRAICQERQIRGSDEPPTLFITCVECHHQWQINS